MLVRVATITAVRVWELHGARVHVRPICMTGAPLLATLAAVLVLASVHVFSGALRFLDRVPRSRWLSFAGGVAVALVFLEILPELAEGQATVTRTLGPAAAFLDDHVYIVAAIGLALFYGMDRMVKTSRSRQRAVGTGDHTSDGVFWLSIALVATKNATVGYLLAREPRAAGALALFTIALGFEFLVGDRGMHADHKANYDRIGRWILAGALLAGWGIGAGVDVPEPGLSMLSAFLAGMIVLNVFKEELPEERQSRFWAFATGLAGYGALLLVQ